MPPKQTTSRNSRGQRPASKGKQPAGTHDRDSSDPFQSSDDQAEANDDRRRTSTTAAGEAEEQPEKSIPRDLLTRVLHEFFAKDATRISRDGNAAVGKYVDVFIREAIARAAVERKGGFLEVEDLEKIAPQLLLDL